MIVTVVINTCRDCRYLGSSGGFTPGGPLPVCEHVYAYKYIGLYGKEEGRDILSGNHWIHRVPFADWNKPKLPEWCPLAHGSKY